MYSELKQIFNTWIAEDKCRLSSQARIFTLKELYDLLSYELRAEMDYLAFRKALYNSPLNSDLQKFGYKVDIYESGDTVDSSLYQLIPVPS